MEGQYPFLPLMFIKKSVEGVEEEEQLAALKQTKIQLVQGFYFGKPMSAKEFEETYL